MGCDIHAAIELRAAAGQPWEAALFPQRYAGAPLAELPFGRNYDAFAILAGVRNGVGFAGLPTGDRFHPISAPRGLPEDISETARAACQGDHSDSWVTVPELLAYDWARPHGTGTYASASGELWLRWVPEMLRIAAEVGADNVRLVFNFDS